MQAPHPAKGEVDVLWSEVLLVLVEFVRSVPVVKTLIPLLLHFLGRRGKGEEGREEGRGRGKMEEERERRT